MEVVIEDDCKGRWRCLHIDMTRDLNPKLEYSCTPDLGKVDSSTRPSAEVGIPQSVSVCSKLLEVGSGVRSAVFLPEQGAASSSHKHAACRTFNILDERMRERVSVQSPQHHCPSPRARAVRAILKVSRGHSATGWATRSRGFYLADPFRAY